MLTRVVLTLISVTAWGCGPTAGSGGADATGTTELTSGGSWGSTSGSMSADVTSAPVDDSGSTSTSTTGAEPVCAVGDEPLLLAVLPHTEAWPEVGGFTEVECAGESTFVDGDFLYLVLTCLHPTSATEAEIQITVPSNLVTDQFADFPTMTGLLASFYNPGAGNCGLYCFQVSLREADGTLLLLGQVRSFSPAVEEGEAVDVGKPDWLRPGSEAYESWSAPFDDLVARNVGCADQVEPVGWTLPLALEFTGDDGLVRLYHDTFTYDVSVQGEHFDIGLRMFNRLDRDRFEFYEDVSVQFVAVRSSG